MCRVGCGRRGWEIPLLFRDTTHQEPPCVPLGFSWRIHCMAVFEAWWPCRNMIGWEGPYM